MSERSENSKDKQSSKIENIMFLNHKNQTKMIFEITSHKHMLQGPANYDPQAKSSPPPIFVNKILLTHIHPHLFTCIYGCFYYTSQFSGCDGYFMDHRAKNIY